MKWLYYRFIYGRLMRFAHRHNWHKMERNPNIEPGKVHLWCHWCGIRSVIIEAHTNIEKEAHRVNEKEAHSTY